LSFVSVVCCQVDELITRPEKSYRLWCVVVCDLETTKILVIEEEAKAHWGAIAPREKKILAIYWFSQELWFDS